MPTTRSLAEAFALAHAHEEEAEKEGISGKSGDSLPAAGLAEGSTMSIQLDNSGSNVKSN
jgi:hypothetical protein